MYVILFIKHIFTGYGTGKCSNEVSVYRPKRQANNTTVRCSVGDISISIHHRFCIQPWMDTVTVWSWWC